MQSLITSAILSSNIPTPTDHEKDILKFTEQLRADLTPIQRQNIILLVKGEHPEAPELSNNSHNLFAAMFLLAKIAHPEDIGKQEEYMIALFMYKMFIDVPKQEK